MIETIDTQNAPAAIGPYSQAKEVNGLIFTSGQIPISPKSGEIVGRDIESQTKQALDNLSAILEAADTSLDMVVKTSCFLADMNDFAVFNRIYEQYFKMRPARSCISVKALPKNVLVEVEAIAAKP